VSCRIALALLVVLYGSSVRAGLMVVMQEADGQSTMLLEGKRLRMERAGSPPQIVIFDGDTSRYLQIDPHTRTYSEMTRADGQAIAARLREALARLTPEERERAEALLGKAPRSRHEVKYQPTGERSTVAGVRCEVHRKMRDGVAVEEGCFIPWSSGVVTKDDLAGLLLFGQFMDQMLSGAAGATGGVADQLYGELERAPGFPAVMTRLGESGRVGKDQRLVSLERKRIAPEQFSVPAGYSLVKMSLPE
jgi:hypothetical protein